MVEGDAMTPVPPARKPHVVLIVDASSDTRDMYHEFLRDDISLLVVTAPTCEVALHLCEGVRPHVIVADLGLRTRQGTSFWDEIRQKVGGSVRLVAISAVPVQPEAADVVLLKPVRPDALRDAVHR